jgi:hypothetical protein
VESATCAAEGSGGTRSGRSRPAVSAASTITAPPWCIPGASANSLVNRSRRVRYASIRGPGSGFIRLKIRRNGTCPRRNGTPYRVIVERIGGLDQGSGQEGRQMETPDGWSLGRTAGPAFPCAMSHGIDRMLCYHMNIDKTARDGSAEWATGDSTEPGLCHYRLLWLRQFPIDKVRGASRGLGDASAYSHSSTYRSALRDTVNSPCAMSAGCFVSGLALYSTWKDR